MRPSSLRDSGIIATPARRLAAGSRPQRRCPRRASPRPQSPRVGAEDRARELGAPGADEARPGRRSRPRAPRATRRRRRGALSSRTEQHDAARRPRGGCFGGNVAVSGRPSIASTSDASVSAAVGRVCDEPAVAQHRDGVGQLEHLAQEVRDEHDRLPGGGERADDLVQPLASRARRAPPSARPSRSAARRATSARRISTCCCSDVRSRPAGASAGQLEPRRRGELRVARGAAARRRMKPPPRRLGAEEARSRRPSAAARPTAPARSWRRRARAPPAASGTRPRRRRAASARRRRRCTPATILPSVDLPAPFSPTSAWTEPARDGQR